MHCQQNCWNRDALQRFADTSELAGRIVCNGSVENPYGRICTARVVAETPVALLAVAPAIADVSDVPGFRMMDYAA